MRNTHSTPRRTKRARADPQPDTVLTPHCKIWLERDGQIALSDWRVELLELVQETGSLAAAAKRLKVPYRTAWYKLKDLEARWGIPLLVTASGGAAGGGSRLTKEAQQIVGRFQRVTAGVRQLVEERVREEFKDGEFISSLKAQEQRG